MADIASPPRRGFIVQAACTFAGVGSAMALWPFIDQMSPNPAAPQPEATEVDLAPIQPGQTILVQWRGLPILVRHRTPEEVRTARSARLSDLVDRSSRNQALPKTASAEDENRTKAGHESWLVVVGLCTHMGCVLRPKDAAAAGPGEGWVCPCHAVRYDLSGRVVAGPSRINLAVPPYMFLSESRILIG